jgi:hypothetical protein
MVCVRAITQRFRRDAAMAAEYKFRQGEGKERAASVETSENQAVRYAHHLAGRGGTVEFKDEHGRFTHCLCAICRKNRYTSSNQCLNQHVEKLNWDLLILRNA